MRSLNEFHSDIKFTYELSKKSTSFLDPKFGVENSKIITDLYVKPTDCYQYLHTCLLIQATPNDL